MYQNNSLVSVVVATYNSSKTIVETLDSIFKQTYQNIELIITDDCSKDNTLATCEEWIQFHHSRFTDVKLIKSETNTGIANNLNRGVYAANGEWIKSIAGDDLLYDYSIAKYIDFVNKHNCAICMAKLKLFPIENTYSDLENYLKPVYKVLETKDREKQYIKSIHRHILPGPGIFYKKTLFCEIGGFDKKYPYSEEYSFQIRVFQKYPVYFIPEELVLWRQRTDSQSKKKFSPTYYDDVKFFFNERLWLLVKEGFFADAIEESIKMYIFKKNYCDGKNSKYYKYLFYLSPNKYINKIKSIINK